MEIHLILTICIVNFGLTSGQPYNQIANQAVLSEVIDENGVQGKFRSLFDVNAKNDAKNSKILQKEAVRERQAFNAMREELWTAQIRNSYKRKNFYEKSNAAENVVAKKRETANNRCPAHPDVAESSAEEKVPFNAETFYKAVSDNLKHGICEAFINDLRQHFARSLKRAPANTSDSKIGASEDELQKEISQVFTKMLTMTGLPVENLDEHDLLVRTDNFVHVFEIKFATDSDEEANFRCDVKYLNKYIHGGKDVVCWGVSLLTGNDRPDGVVGEWKAEIFTEEGKLKRSVARTLYKPGNKTFDD